MKVMNLLKTLKMHLNVNCLLNWVNMQIMAKHIFAEQTKMMVKVISVMKEDYHHQNFAKQATIVRNISKIH